MPQQVLTPQLAIDLANKVGTQRLTTLDIERQKFGKNKGKIIAKWEEGSAPSVPGENFTMTILQEIAIDLSEPKTIIATINIKKAAAEVPYVTTYAAAKEKSNAHQ